MLVYSKAIIVATGILLFVSSSISKEQKAPILNSDSATSKPSKSKLIAKVPTNHGGAVYLYDEDCDLSAFSKEFPKKYIQTSDTGSTIGQSCYSLNKQDQSVTLADHARTVLYLNSEQKQTQRDKKDPVASQKAVHMSQAEIIFRSVPEGARVLALSSGRQIGITPFRTQLNYDANTVINNCVPLPKVKILWISGAEYLTRDKEKACLQSGVFVFDVKRPKVAGLQIDIEYPIKLQQLKLQQEQLEAQQRHNNAMQQEAARQAEAQERQAKAANEMLIYQMFSPKISGSSNSSPTILDINGRSKACIKVGPVLDCN